MTELLPSILAILVLLVLSGFLSGSETAMTAVARERIFALVAEGNRRAALVKRLIEDRERLIGTLLVGNNVVNILAAALATEILIRLTGDAGVVYATFVMTVLVVIFGEVLPKTYAIRHAEQAAMFAAPVIRLMVIALAPVSVALRFIVNGVLRLFGTQLEGGSLIPVTDQLRGAIEVYHAEGAMQKLERDMLGAVLDLQEVEVGEIMTHRSNMITLDADQPLEQLVAFVQGAPHTRYPVWKDDPDQIIGVLHSKDLISLVGSDGLLRKDAAIADILGEAWFIPDTTSLYQQLLAFRQQRKHLALVVDEYGSLMGLVTLEDIIEEIVGDIVDEKDVEVSGIELGEDGLVEVDGRVAIRDVNRRFDWDLPDDEAATMAGLVMHKARRIPKEGESFNVGAYRIMIAKRNRHHLSRLQITALPRPSGEHDASD